MIVLQEVKVLQRRSDWVSFKTGRTLNLFRVRAKTLKVYLFHHPIFKRKSSNYPSLLHRRILAFFCYKSEWPPKELRPTKKARWLLLSAPESERQQQPPRLSQTASASPLSMPFLTILLDLETVSVCASSSTHKSQNFTMTFA